MSTKWIGWIAAGVSLIAAAGGLYWYLKRREAKRGEGTPEPVPSEPFPPPTNPKQTGGFEFMSPGELDDETVILAIDDSGEWQEYSIDALLPASFHLI